MNALEQRCVATGEAPWALAVFASRDRPQAVVDCVEHLLAASAQASCIDVLVNGNAALADELARWAAAQAAQRLGQARLRIWSMPRGDKALAFNAYLHDVWPGSRLTFFVDGYVCVAPVALSSLERALAQQREGLCAAGMPTVGWSARGIRRTMLREGGLHGNLFALSQGAVQGLRQRGFRLPAGLYRVDSTIGAALAFNLDPASHEWDPRRYIVNDAGAAWARVAEATTLHGTIKRYLSRRQRQAQGDFENRAVAHFLARQRTPIGALPATVLELVDAWAVANPAAADEVRRRGRRWEQAWRELHAPAATPPLAARFSLVHGR